MQLKLAFNYMIKLEFITCTCIDVICIKVECYKLLKDLEITYYFNITIRN